MLEVRQGNSNTAVLEWDRHKNLTDPVYRFQAIDHKTTAAQPLLSPISVQLTEVAPDGMDYRSGDNASATSLRIHQLCSSLQSLLDKSRSRERRQRPTNTFTINSSTCTRTRIPPIKDYGISQTHLYVDSGGTLHGPLDLKHSAKLDGIQKNYETYGMKQNRSWAETQRSQSSGKHWDARSDVPGGYNTMETRRSRQYSESRGQVGAQIDGLLDDLNKMGQTHNYYTVANHSIGGAKQHIPRWSSLQTVGNDGGRYSTTVTRRHVTTGGTGPVEFHIRQPMSSGVSKVDLLSIENRKMQQPAIAVQVQGSPRNTLDDKRLMDELIETRRELQRTRSMMSESGQRGLGTTTWTTKTYKEVPTRTLSQTNVQNLSSSMRNNWTSENNVSRFKTSPFISTYSAHQANLRQRNEMNQQRNMSSHSARGTEEITQETVSLQPIGKGVHDLDSNLNSATLPRAVSHGAMDYADKVSVASAYPATAGYLTRSHGYRQSALPPQTPRSSVRLQGRSFDMHSAERDSHANNRPAVTNHQTEINRSYSLGGDERHHRGHNYSGAQSPSLSQRVVEHRSRTTRTEASQWRHVNGVASSFESINGAFVNNHIDSVDGRQSIVQVQELSHLWFRPTITREQATNILINREIGSFFICQSRSQPEYYVLVLRVPTTVTEPEPVRSFFMERIPAGPGGGDSYHLRGYETEPRYPSLPTFVHEHMRLQGVLPVRLRLPKVSGETRSLLGYSPNVRSPTNADFTIDVLYLGSFDASPLEGAAAVRTAVQQALADANNPSKGLRTMCEAVVQAGSHGTGVRSITIIDKKPGIRFSKKTIEGFRIMYCGYDPDARVFNSPELRNKGVAESQLLGIVVKKKRFTITKHMVYVMCQLEGRQPSSNLINYINQSIIGVTPNSPFRR